MVAITLDGNFYPFHGTVRFCTLSDLLLGLCKPALDDEEEEEESAVIPWAEWGPSRTRCTVTSAWYQSDRDLHGLRMPCESSGSATGRDEATGVAVGQDVTNAFPNDTEYDYRIVMFDFNQMAIARDRCNEGLDGTHWQTTDYETTLVIECFRDPIVSRLPFRFAQSERTVLMGGILYDGVNLVLEEEDASFLRTFWLTED